MLSTDIGIDLGASNTLIFEKKKGIVLNEPSIIIIDNKTKKVVEIGNLAYKVIGKEPNNIQIIRCKNEENKFLNLKLFFLKAINKGIKTNNANGINTYNNSKLSNFTLFI
jgi:actin-like ATPase involved in cell morphogenesis